MTNEDWLDHLTRQLTPTDGSRSFPWPMPGRLDSFVFFPNLGDWQKFILRFGLHGAVPQIVTAKFQRAQKLYLLSWIDGDLMKAGELVALTALELALRDRYAHLVKAERAKNRQKPKNEPQKKPKKQKEERITLADLLAYMTAHDQLTDDKLPMIRRSGGAVIDPATGKLSIITRIRNELAHGYPFDGLPWSGLLELVGDLIHYAYRHMIDEATSGGTQGPRFS